MRLLFFPVVVEVLLFLVDEVDLVAVGLVQLHRELPNLLLKLPHPVGEAQVLGVLSLQRLHRLQGVGVVGLNTLKSLNKKTITRIMKYEGMKNKGQYSKRGKSKGHECLILKNLRVLPVLI